MSRLPKLSEARQMCRLRALRVQRARERCGQAQIELDQAAQAVSERQRAIDRRRGEIDALNQAVVNQLAPELPRWSTVVAAQRERLADLLERDEFALIEDEHHLEQMQERLQQARADVTRALAREDAVRGLAEETARARAHERERRSEVDLEDQGRPQAASRSAA